MKVRTMITLGSLAAMLIGLVMALSTAAPDPRDETTAQAVGGTILFFAFFVLVVNFVTWYAGVLITGARYLRDHGPRKAHQTMTAWDLHRQQRDVRRGFLFAAGLDAYQQHKHRR